MSVRTPTVPVPAKRAVPSDTVVYKDISALITNNDSLGEIFDAAMVVKGNEIAWVGKQADLQDTWNADKVVSMANTIVSPGLINTHNHMNQTLVRCIGTDYPLFNWLLSLYPGMATYTGEDVFVSAKLAMAELIMNGCTTSSDHLYVYANDVTLDDTIRASREIGMRFQPVRGIMTMGASRGGLPPDEVVEDLESALADTERLIQEFHDDAKFSMLRISVGPCAPFTVENECMTRGADLARKYKVRLHTHLAENTQDLEYCRKNYDCTPAEYIKKVGWDQDDCWFAHCTLVTKEEIQLFSERGIGIAHCPSSNCRLASGILPSREVLDGGVNIGLGVDGAASEDSQNLLEQMRWAMMLQRGRLQDVKGLKLREAFYMATKGGAKNLGRDDIGELSPGFAADFVAWNTKGNLSLAGSLHDPVSSLVLCTPGPVYYAVINGEMIVDKGKFTTIDVESLVEDHNKRSARICAICKESEKAAAHLSV
ncbi:hypothetical protein M9435_001769 [Picochlorum sp. BPE23]|nr:hypothetical protein M9435_001769 [Picochlorum sp. BPE23]